jgi:hypothetical protein
MNSGLSYIGAVETDSPSFYSMDEQDGSCA